MGAAQVQKLKECLSGIKNEDPHRMSGRSLDRDRLDGKEDMIKWEPP